MEEKILQLGLGSFFFSAVSIFRQNLELVLRICSTYFYSRLFMVLAVSFIFLLLFEITNVATTACTMFREAGCMSRTSE